MKTEGVLPASTFSKDEGPVCPFCERQYTADELHYYDEDGFTIECDECDNTIRVQPVIETSWITTPVSRHS